MLLDFAQTWAVTEFWICCRIGAKSKIGFTWVESDLSWLIRLSDFQAQSCT